MGKKYVYLFGKGMTDGNYRLLIAEDDVSLRRIVSAFFTKNGFDVDQAGDGAEAERLIVRHLENARDSIASMGE